jgi:hypothetical protein
MLGSVPDWLSEDEEEVCVDADELLWELEDELLWLALAVLLLWDADEVFWIVVAEVPWAVEVLALDVFKAELLSWDVVLAEELSFGTV